MRSSSGPSQCVTAPCRQREGTPRGALASSSTSRRAVRGSGANGATRTRPSSTDHRPATKPSTRNGRPDLAALDDRGAVLVREHATTVVVARARGCRSVGGGALARACRREEAARAGGRRAHGRARRGIASARAAPTLGRRRSAPCPSTARCRHATPARTRRDSGGRDVPRRRLPKRRRRPATSVPGRTCRPPCGSARPRTPGRSPDPRAPRARTRRATGSAPRSAAWAVRAARGARGRVRGCSAANAARRSPSSGEVGVLAERCELALELPDPARAVDAARTRGSRRR